MTDTNTQNTDIQQPQQPNADPAATGENKGKLFTQDEVNRIVSERLNRERDKAAQAAAQATDAATVRIYRCPDRTSGREGFLTAPARSCSTKPNSGRYCSRSSGRLSARKIRRSRSSCLREVSPSKYSSSNRLRFLLFLLPM